MASESSSAPSQLKAQPGIGLSSLPHKFSHMLKRASCNECELDRENSLSPLPSRFEIVVFVPQTNCISQWNHFPLLTEEPPIHRETVSPILQYNQSIIMAIISQCRFGHQQIRRISQAAYERLRPIPNDRLIWKANEDDPRKHTKEHEGLFYILPDEKQIQTMFGHPSPYDLEASKFYRTIGMMPLMVRQPALDAMDYLRKTSTRTLPNVKILFYGDKGHGKTHTLTHLLHYLHLNQEHFIIHIREMKRYTYAPRYQEFGPSTSRPGRIDTGIDAAILLQQFKNQNAHLLDKHKDTLTCSKDYTWSLREATKAGEPLVNVADHGVNRVIHASDCVAVLMKELMLAADAGKIKLASILDNVRFLFLREAGVLKHPDHKKVLVDEITVARALKKLIKSDYKNGLVLGTADNKLSTKQNQTPQDAIGTEGWEHFDPFLPINVPKYSRKEFDSCMNMYQDIGWLTRPESRTREARDEIRFVSGMNPGQVHYICQPL